MDISNRSITKVLAIAGFCALALWGAWWGASVVEGRFVGGSHTWVPCWYWAGCDFNINYYAANEWLDGGNPYHAYRNPNHSSDNEYEHPPRGRLRGAITAGPKTHGKVDSKENQLMFNRLRNAGLAAAVPSTGVLKPVA